MERSKHAGLSRALIAMLALTVVTACLCAILFRPAVYAEQMPDEIYYTGSDGAMAIADYAESVNADSVVLTKNISLTGGAPTYYNTDNNTTNCCAGVAGAIAVGCYDRVYSEMVPGVDTYNTRFNRYMPMVSSTALKSAIQGIINDLHVRMGTNTIQPGTTETQFLNGLTDYVAAKGQRLVPDSIVSGGQIRVDSLIAALQNDQPVALLATQYNTCTWSATNISINSYLGAHIMIVQGYAEYTFYSANVPVKVLPLLVVQTGMQLQGQQFIYLNYDYATIQNAYALRVV